jgi:hypothetical protein
VLATDAINAVDTAVEDAVDEAEARQLVQGGTLVARGDFGHAVQIRKNGVFIMSGSLIGNRHVALSTFRLVTNGVVVPNPAGGYFTYPELIEVGTSFVGNAACAATAAADASGTAW